MVSVVVMEVPIFLFASHTNTKQRLFACVNCNTNNVPNWLLFVGMQGIACAKMPFGLSVICF
jgi:hypothetical protein